MQKIKLDKVFDYKQYEEKIYNDSIPDIIRTAKSNRKNEFFTITLPPPNITGFLHIGHALTSTIQDILLRFKRQQGFVTFGQPGVDHAGIATQIVVENNLAKEGISRIEIGRDEFVKKVWEWKKTSGGQIVNQLKRLGMTVDWSYERFTMDDASNKAVIYSFVKLYNDGLIYRAKKMVNWDPTLKTAISDLEVTNKNIKGGLWHIKYKIENSDDFITIATTRPETMFGDTAIAVHPEDERYIHLIGKNAILPLVNRPIPIVADLHCDQEKGSGAVKITPAHDFNDFEVGNRHNLETINIMDDSAKLNENVPKEFQGLSREQARTKTLELLEEQNLIEKAEEIQHSVPYNDRSGTIIEPRLTNQWFLNAQELAKNAIKAVEDGRIRFIPDHWSNTYFEWMRNIQPWCISRQIWWGHQIPVWYGPNGETFCAENETEAKILASKHFNCTIDNLPKLIRDPDVLDTWYSSGLWPFSTQYWPDETQALKDHYPNSVLVTGFDIIFFWVARMIMMGMYFMNDVPFKDVYVHPLVRDEKGQKMSKSKGNVIDPLDLMDKYGTDSMRYALASQAIPGRDIKISDKIVENSRNFITKIWNAAKFLELNECSYREEIDIKNVNLPVNLWILSELNKFKNKTFEDFQSYRFDYVSQNIMKFLKDTFCDIYIECLKTMLSNCDSKDETCETKKVAVFAFTEFLKIAHPVIPFVTEHLWKSFNKESDMLLVCGWEKEEFNSDFEAISNVETFIQLSNEIRSLRGVLNVPQSQKLILYSKDDFFLEENIPCLCALAKLEKLEKYTNQQGLKIVLNNKEFFLQHPIDIEKDSIKSIISKKIDEISNDINVLNKKINNDAYKNAKPDQWENDLDLFRIKESEIKKLKSAIE